MKISKDILPYGAGAGVGVTQSVIFKQYVDSYGPIPFIGDYLPIEWSKWSSLGNILIGGIVFSVSQFTKSTKGNLKKFLATYSITTLASGILAGVFSGTVPAARFRQPMRRRPLRLAKPQQTVAPMTPTGTGSATFFA